VGTKRVVGQPAYVLHLHPYSESSLIVDVFSRDHGRLPLLARGARRPRSVMRGLLMAFQPLELDWFGGGEVKTLAKAEWLGGMPLLGGRSLLLGYYLNELLLRLLPRDDAHANLYAAYTVALNALAGTASASKVNANANATADAPELRRFEQALLKELGYGLTLDVDADSRRPVEPGRDYLYLIERGPVVWEGTTPGAEGPTVRGKTLLDMTVGDYADARTRTESKALMRQLIAHYLGGKPLQSRRVFMELQEL